MNHLTLIIKREYFTKVKNKAFIVMTFLSPMLFISLIAIVAYLSQLNSEKISVVDVLDESGLFKEVFINTADIHYNVFEGMTLKDAKALSKEAASNGLLHIRPINDYKNLTNTINFYSEDSPSMDLILHLEEKLQKQLTLQNRINMGLAVDRLEASKVTVEISQESFDGKALSKIDGIVKLVFGGAVGYLLFMFIIIYGNMIMRSVIEEKTSRIIEVVISSVKPIQLMLGKIIGTSLAGITQFVVWAVLGGVLLTVVSIIFGINFAEVKTPQQELMLQTMEQPELIILVEGIFSGLNNLPILNLFFAFIMFFVGGYLLYSSIYAAVGAAVDNETDTQQFVLPILIPLILAVYVGFFTVIEDPHGTISVIFSYIPLTSPVVMLMRIPFGVPIWQQILSLIILLGTFVVVIWFAAKIYRVGILMYNKKPSYKELFKWIKY